MPFAGDYEAPDWIEIHNPTAAIAVLDGYWLSDETRRRGTRGAGAFRPARPSRPADISSSSPRAMASRTRRSTSTASCTPTSSSVPRPETWFWPTPRGTWFPPSSTTRPRAGTSPTGWESTARPRYFAMPTPNDDNAHAYPQAPQFSVPSSSFVDPLVVNLTAPTAGSTIRYTVNGTAPTAASPVWTGPLTLTASTTIRAVAIGSDGLSSTVVSQTYVRLAANVVAFNSDLPLVIIDTFGRAINTAASRIRRQLHRHHRAGRRRPHLSLRGVRRCRPGGHSHPGVQLGGLRQEAVPRRVPGRKQQRLEPARARHARRVGLDLLRPRHVRPR